MTSTYPTLPPPGFENLTPAEQIDYIQHLWDKVIEAAEDVPSPEWHLEILEERAVSPDREAARSWHEVRQRLWKTYGGQ